MALVKCPRCELNYILDGDSLCTVCRREVRGEITEPDDMPELCSECGEVPVVPGNEYCASCLKELNRRGGNTNDDVIAVVEDATLEIESVSAMDEIEIDIGGDLEDEDFDEEDEDFDDEEQEDSLDELADNEIDDDDLLDR